MQTFGEKLRQLRKAQGLTQIELAAALHLQQSQISHLETRHKLPVREYLDAICAYFRVPANYFDAKSDANALDRAKAYIQSLRVYGWPEPGQYLQTMCHQLQEDEREFMDTDAW